MTHAPDSGAYLLALSLDVPMSIRIGALGLLDFASGWYVYVGSAMRGLEARVDRHRRKRKRTHWHIDYLRRRADQFAAAPLPSAERHECAVAIAIAELYHPGPPGFGSSDCRCSTHLFRAPTCPVGDPRLVRIASQFTHESTGDDLWQT